MDASAHNPLRLRYAPAIALGALSLWLLTYPFDFAGEVITPWLGDPWIGKLNTLSNVVMFLPFGIAGGWALSARGRGAAVIAVALAALLISLVGETAQVWLPDRHSSAVDLLANTLGAAMGALFGWVWSAPVTARLRACAAWLEPRPRWRIALRAIGITMLTRLAPFMFNVETYYLRTDLDRSIQASRQLPTSIAALSNVVLSFVLLFVTTLCVGRAMRESFERQGDRSSPAVLMLIVGVALAVVTEVLQWPIRGRVMDVPDLVAATAGVCVAAAVDAVMGPIAKSVR
jgi:VanZ family protein